MGEEEKKAEEPKKDATEELNKPAAKEEKKQAEGGNGDKPKAEKKPEDGGGDKKEEKKDETPPPPPEIVLQVYMHCEACARKVRRSLRGFKGVEDVITDCKTHKVVVKGEKADPLKVLERVQRKSHRQVELLSPLPPPKPPAEEDNKAEEKQPPKPEDKKEEPKVVTVVLKVQMNCEACALQIKKQIERMKDVEVATPELKSSEVTVKGTFDPAKLVQYVQKRRDRHAKIIKQDPEPPKAEDEKPKDDGGQKKGGGEEKKGGDGDKADQQSGGADGCEETKVVEVRRNEYYYYPPKYAVDMYAYPPQIFSDENPNACSIV